nr:RHS repeat-associated core domain-containing protein [Niveispirillum sp. BGYR6]
MLGESAAHAPDAPSPDPLAIVYLHEPGSFRPLAQLRRNGGADQRPQVYHYHLDHLGTPQELTNDNGELVWQAEYRAWGALAKLHVAEVENPLRFQGQYHDAETGLHYNRHRYYAPNEGCFTTQDPIRLAGGSNLAAYAPNPVEWVDPLGLSCISFDQNAMRFRAKNGQFVAARDVFSSPKDEAYFWSGLGHGGDAIAAKVATSKGGTTLEMLAASKGVDMPKWDGSPGATKAWQNASAAYAEGASGKVRAVLGDNLRPGNIWETFELPALKNNPTVTQISRVHPNTEIETIIWSR